MKLWIDDVRPALLDSAYEYGEIDYIHVRSVNEAKALIEFCDEHGGEIELIDIDHDAGDFVNDGGDYIKLLDWLEETGRNYPIRIHSMNPVGAENMRRIIQRNGWTEVK